MKWTSKERSYVARDRCVKSPGGQNKSLQLHRHEQASFVLFFTGKDNTLRVTNAFVGTLMNNNRTTQRQIRSKHKNTNLTRGNKQHTQHENNDEIMSQESNNHNYFRRTKEEKTNNTSRSNRFRNSCRL